MRLTFAFCAGSLLALSVWAPGVAATPPSRIAALHKTDLGPVGDGRRDFLMWNCYGCHGMNGGGAIAGNIQHAEKGDVTEAVLHGEEGGMPSFRKYATKTDAANITAYLATIGTSKEPTWVDWWNPNP